MVHAVIGSGPARASCFALLLVFVAACGDAPMNVYYPQDAATETPNVSPRASEAPTDKLGTPAPVPSGGASDAQARGRASEHATPAPAGPPPWDAAVFVGRGAANVPPDAFKPYPRDLKKEDLPALGALPQDPDDPTYFIARPTTEMYEHARIWYGSSDKPKRVSIVRYTTADPRGALLELRNALEKRYGKGRARPDGATDEDADRFLWTAPRMSLGFDQPEQIMLEMIYQQ